MSGKPNLSGEREAVLVFIVGLWLIGLGANIVLMAIGLSETHAVTGGLGVMLFSAGVGAITTVQRTLWR